MVLLATLALLAFGVGQQQVKANHELLILQVVIAAAAGGVVVWLITRNGDDPPDPATTDPPAASRSTLWRPLPEMAQRVFDKQFGGSPRFPSSFAFTHATHEEPTPLGDDLRGAIREIRRDPTRAWIAGEGLTRLVPVP